MSNVLILYPAKAMAAPLSPPSMFHLPEPGEGELETNVSLRVGKDFTIELAVTANSLFVQLKLRTSLLQHMI